jgi:hypothetical protein
MCSRQTVNEISPSSVYPCHENVSAHVALGYGKEILSDDGAAVRVNVRVNANAMNDDGGSYAWCP